MHRKLIPTLAVIAAFGLCSGCGPRSSDVAVKVATLRERFGDVYSNGLDFSPDGNQIAIESDGLRINIWDWRKRLIVRTLLQPPGAAPQALNPLKYSPDGHVLAACSTAGVRIWSTADWSVVQDMGDDGYGGCKGIAFSPDGQLMFRADAASHSNNESVFVYSVPTWQNVWNFGIPFFSAGALAFRPDGRFAAIEGDLRIYPSGAHDAIERIQQMRIQGITNILDIEQRKVVQTLRGDARGPVAWSPDGRRIGVVGDLYVEIFNAKTGQRLVHDEEAKSGSLNVRFTPDGSYYIESDLNGMGKGLGVKIWDAQRQNLLQSIRYGDIGSIAVSRDSRYLAVGSTGRTTIWELK